MSACRCPKDSVRNRALIVCIENFDLDVDLIQRRGVKRDIKRLDNILTKLGFYVLIKKDITAHEIYETFKAGNICTSFVIMDFDESSREKHYMKYFTGVKVFVCNNAVHNYLQTLIIK